MSREVWSTYSVNDHLYPQNFPADVMLFDRLVFPVPEDGEFPHFDAGYDPTLPLEWIRIDAEWRRWEVEGWSPAEQQEWLEILGPLARRVPWKDEGEVGERYVAASETASKHLAGWEFDATRTALTQGLPAYVTGVASFGQRYRTFEDFRAECLPEKRKNTVMPGRALIDVLAAEFLVPSPDPRLHTRTLLRETVAFVSGDQEFRDKRTAFHDWQDRFLKDGVTDESSIARAREEMADRLSELRKASERLKVRKRVRNVFRLAPAALGLAAAELGGGLGFAVAGAFLSIGSFVVDERLFKSAEASAPPHVAFIFDARRHLGWM